MHRIPLLAIVLLTLATAACTADTTPTEEDPVATEAKADDQGPAKDETKKAPPVVDQGVKPANNPLYAPNATNPLFSSE